MITILVVALTVVASLVIAVVVLKKNPESATNRLVASLSIITALWTVFNYLALVPGASAEERLFWVRTVMFFTTPYGTVILLLANAFPTHKLSYPNKVLSGLIVFNLVTAALAISPYMFTRVENTSQTNFNLFPGWAILFYAVGFMGFMTYGFVQLIKKYKISSGLLRSQLRLFVTGIIVSFTLLTLTNFVAVLVFRSIQLTYLGPPFTLIMFAFIIYAIVRHRFLDITSIVARAVTYTLTLLVIVGIEVAILAIGVKLLPPSVDRVMVAAAGAVLIVLGYDYLRLRINQLTERIFFQGRYDTEDLLARLTGIMASVIEIERLSEKLLTSLVEEMRLTRAAFVLVDEHEVKHVEAVNWEDAEKLKKLSVENMLHTNQKKIIFEELEEGELKQLMRESGITVMFPLKLKVEEIGLLLLGPKASGDIYAERDLELLSIFAPQVAVALNNARSYQEIKDFSKTLEKKVDERTEELKAEQKERLAKANELLKIKDEFVFIATHDLATPVTAISGFVQLVKNSLKKLPKDVQSDIEAIDEATDRLRTLVNDLLEVARGESGTIKVKLTPIDLNHLVKETVVLVSQRAKEKKVTIKLELDPAGKAVMADQAKLAEVMENLLSNAVKYNREGGKVMVRSKKEGSSLVVEVEDTGIGIPQKEQEQVFNKFFRSESEETRKQTGTGLGLFVVKMLVTKMKGKISFTSKEGVGTTFRLVFGLA